MSHCLLRPLARHWAATLLLAGTAGAQGFHVEACTLGCTSGAGGAPVWCAVVNVHVDETLRVRFNQPVDPASLDAASFSVVDVQTGTHVLGTRYVSPVDPREVVFEPAVTFGVGGVSYAFVPQHTYELLLPGTRQGDGPPHVTSTGGAPNEGRLQCTIVTSQGYFGPIRRECLASTNSTGSAARIGWSGSTSWIQNDLVLEATALPPSTLGLFVLGTAPAYSPVGNGHLCLGGVLIRQAVVAANASGRATFAFDVGAVGSGVLLLPGDTWRFQHVFRDVAAGGAGFDTTDALRVTFFP